MKIFESDQDLVTVDRLGEPDYPGPEGLDYVAECDKTASGTFRCDHVGRAELLFALRMVVTYATLMDKFKKAMFRKRSRVESGLATYGFADDVVPASDGPPLRIPDEFADLFHGIIGNITEVGEQAEILVKYLETETVDKVNVREEIGDNLWYISRLIRWCDTTFLSEMKRNIAKLRARHGETFNKERDITRDLSAERKLLEE